MIMNKNLVANRVRAILLIIMAIIAGVDCIAINTVAALIALMNIRIIAHVLIPNIITHMSITVAIAILNTITIIL